MSIGGLATLGKIAGVGGIALGAVVLLGDKLIGTVGKMPAADQAAAVHLITIGLFGIGALGLVVWVIGSWSRGISASSTGDSSPAIVAGGNVGVNAPAGATPARKGGGPGVPHGAARTRGDHSAAVIAGGSASVNTELPAVSIAAHGPKPKRAANTPEP